MQDILKNEVSNGTTKTWEELKREVPKISKQIQSDLEDYLKVYPDPRTMMTSKTSFICRSYSLMGIIFELLLLNEPHNIKRSIDELLH